MLQDGNRDFIGTSSSMHIFSKVVEHFRCSGRARRLVQVGLFNPDWSILALVLKWYLEIDQP